MSRVDWRINDHKTILMNLINKKRVMKDRNAKFIQEYAINNFIVKYAKANNLSTLQAIDTLIEKVKTGELVI